MLTTEQATEELNVSPDQILALLKTGELRAIQVGGKGNRGMCRGLDGLEEDIAGARRGADCRRGARR